jgi:hypothetical protein
MSEATGESTSRGHKAKGNGAAQPGDASASVFDNLDALRLSSEDAANVDTREILSRVPVRKPDRAEFFRVHPNQEMQITTGVYVNRQERETYFVAPELRGEMAGEWRPVLLVTAITRQNVIFLWPVNLPNQRGQSNEWAESARHACELAKTSWVRLIPDLSLGAYRI